MRWVICALAMLAFASRASADDFDVLRGMLPVGPATFTNWSGFYAGGEAGYSSARTDFSNATSSLIADSLRELALESEDSVSSWPVLGSGAQSLPAYGGFVGYSSQWQDLILGIEADFTGSPFNALASVSPLYIQTNAAGNVYDVAVTGSGSLHLDGYGELRARAGYVLGNFLPYGFAGAAIGWSSYNITSLVSGQQNPSSPPVVPCNTRIAPTCVDLWYPNSATQNSALMYGFTVGGGLDVALTPNLFLRGEFEFVQFAPVSNILVSIASVRAGVGVRF